VWEQSKPLRIKKLPVSGLTTFVKPYTARCPSLYKARSKYWVLLPLASFKDPTVNR